MSEVSSLDELLALQKKERKELTAKTQKMKHGVPKGDKKKKKEVTAEITQLLADLDIKHEKEIKEFESKSASIKSTNEAEATESNVMNVEINSEDVIPKEAECVNPGSETNDGESANKGAQRISKAQKRRNKKAQAEKEREKAIAEQEIENLNSLRHLESEEIKKKLSERHLTIHEVPSDGNCLYKAIEHQLSTLNLKQMAAQSLRERTAEYMLSHMEDYIPFLTSPETGDVLTEDQYQKYCEDIANTSAWGGHIEIQALSQVCEMPIEVIQAQGPSVIAGDEKSDPKLILSYHRHVYGLGEHYNSVIPKTDD